MKIQRNVTHTLNKFVNLITILFPTIEIAKVDIRKIIKKIIETEKIEFNYIFYKNLKNDFIVLFMIALARIHCEILSYS